MGKMRLCNKHIVPAGAIEPEKRLWKRSKDNKFLFPQHALNSVFRARPVMLLRSHDLVVFETAFSKDWIIDCEYAGSGAPALKYLARYLYRGVIACSRPAGELRHVSAIAETVAGEYRYRGKMSEG